MSGYKKKVYKFKYEREPGKNIGMAKVDYRRKRDAEKKLSSDSALRKELQEKMKSLAEEGKGILEIVQIIKQDGKYNKFKEFFISYAENHVSKVKKAKEKKANGLEK